MNASPTNDPRLAALPPPPPPPAIDPDDLELDSLKVVARLRRHGHEAYLVGGCVRDLLCGAHPKDYDVATSAHPEQIREVFWNSRLIGRRFRLAHVFFPGGRFVEVATFRATPVQATEETSTEDSTDLLVTDDNQFGTAEEDALRRDFTVNGLLYDPFSGAVIDFVGGREDLEKRRIRTIGDPEIRMREDPVRGLRAARIAAKLGFEIDPPTFEAMSRHAGELPRCAPARVLEETLKLLRSGASRESFRLVRAAGLLKVLLPAVEKVLRQGGEPLTQRFDARLSALDAMVGEGTAVTDPVMLATLLAFLPVEPAEGDEDEAGETQKPVPTNVPSADRVLAQLSQQARLPRRIADRVRAVLAAQRQFTAPAKKKRRRGGSSGAGFVRAPHFAEALQLFEIEVRAGGASAEVLERWRTKAREAAEREEQAPVVAADATSETESPSSAEVASATDEKAPEAPAKKRRRRGGRRRGKGAGGGTPSGETGSTGGTGEA